MLVHVAVPVPLAHAFTYGLAEGVPMPRPGSRVAVPFGARRVLGVVLGEAREAPAGVELRNVLEVLDTDEPAVPEELLQFLVELARYYFAPIGEVLRSALPALDRASAARLADVLPEAAKGAVGRRVRWIAPTAIVEEPGTLRGVAALLLAHVRANGAVPLAHLVEKWPSARAASTRLAELGLVTVEERNATRDPYFSESIARDAPPDLSDAQAAATSAIEAALASGASHGFLLHGVTGSGKTEVYLRAIAENAKLGKGALVLVPEIALTPQLVDRYRARFGDAVAVLHSGLKPGDRLAMWSALRRGEVAVAIGARSALFAPVPDLGLVIVDEEHDPSFKQEEGVRYHARDMALLRAHRASAVCILGSATPSLEANELAIGGKVTLLPLPERARKDAVLPQVLVVDLTRTGPGPSGDPRLSLPLHRRMEQTLARGEQVILFLNRRGFAPSVLCGACGTIASCPSCSVSLTFHRRTSSLRCHYCDHEQPYRGTCPKCGSDQVSLEGLGTERLEDTIAKSFPNARVARLDRDTGGGERAEAVLAKLRARKIDILVGTQMVAKGHDVPSVTLVGVVDADAALSMPDFRAAERTFHLLVQVAGRAGRGDTPGTVVLQTRMPMHPAIALAASHDVAGFASRERASRKELLYPPFSRLALVRVEAVSETEARDAATLLANEALATQGARRGELFVLGPAAAPIARLRARYRFQILLKSKERGPLRQALARVVAARARLDRRIRAIVDVDPVSML